MLKGFQYSGRDGTRRPSVTWCLAVVRVRVCVWASEYVLSLFYDYFSKATEEATRVLSGVFPVRGAEALFSCHNGGKTALANHNGKSATAHSHFKSA